MPCDRLTYSTHSATFLWFSVRSTGQTAPAIGTKHRKLYHTYTHTHSRAQLVSIELQYAAIRSRSNRFAVHTNRSSMNWPFLTCLCCEKMPKSVEKCGQKGYSRALAALLYTLRIIVVQNTRKSIIKLCQILRFSTRLLGDKRRRPFRRLRNRSRQRFYHSLHLYSSSSGPRVRDTNSLMCHGSE